MVLQFPQLLMSIQKCPIRAHGETDRGEHRQNRIPHAAMVAQPVSARATGGPSKAGAMTRDKHISGRVGVNIRILKRDGDGNSQAGYGSLQRKCSRLSLIGM